MKSFAEKLKNIYLLSFFIPILLMLGIFVERGIFPFGKNSFMFSDMYHQYVPFLTEFWHKLHGGESLAYSWHAGLGSNFVAIYAYYLASPVNWLAYLCPEAYLIEFMTYFIVLKIGLCGLTFAVYLSRHYETKDLRIVWFSVFYAMSGFIAAYSWNHMWMDVLWLAPLVILGLEELVTKRRYRLYCLALTASILTNYYLSILLCFFLVLYFFLQLFTNGLSWKRKASAVLHFTLTSLLAGGMAGILLFPVMNAMHVTDFHDISFPKKIEFYFNALEMLARHVPMLPTERGLDHWPNIYCGVLAFVLVPVWFFHKKIPLKQKIGKFLLLAFMLLGFSVNILNFIWHGLNYPDSLPARQSFLYIFVILTMCFEAVYRNAENGRWNCIAGVVSGMLLLAACGIFVTTDGLTVEVMACAWIFLAGYLLLGLLFNRKLRLWLLRRQYRRQAEKESGKRPVHAAGRLRYLAAYGKWAVLLLVCVEAVLNMEHTSVKAVQRPYYLNKKAAYQELTEMVEKTDADFFRMDSVKQMTKNDGMLAGYSSASIFSSTINGNVKDFYKKLGMGGSKVSYYYKGATPFTNALLGVRYLVSDSEDMDQALYEQLAQSGTLYLYRCRQTLPAGFMISEELKDGLEEILSSKMANPLIMQNNLSKEICGSNLFTALSGEEAHAEENSIMVSVETAGHLYGVVSGTPEGSILFSQDGESRELEDVSSDFVLDLGWFDAGTQFTITAEEEESLSIRLYRLSAETIQEVVRELGREPFEAESCAADEFSGTITAQASGYLVLSVPSEPGWQIWVDGRETECEQFAEAMIAVPLSEGSHTIEMKYVIHGMGAGICCTAVSLVLFVLIYGRKKNGWKGKQ